MSVGLSPAIVTQAPLHQPDIIVKIITIEIIIIIITIKIIIILVIITLLISYCHPGSIIATRPHHRNHMSYVQCRKLENYVVDHFQMDTLQILK